MTSYDTNNIFAKILRGEIPSKIVKETHSTLAFHDAFPKAPIHILVIPKGSYVNMAEFLNHARDEEIVDFWSTVQGVIEELKLQETGFRMISNNGTNGGQEVSHFHIHLCGGEKLGPMLPKA